MNPKFFTLLIWIWPKLLMMNATCKILSNLRVENLLRTNSEKKCGFSVCWSRLVPLLLLIVVGCGWTLWEWGYRKAIKYRFPRANRSLGLLDTPLTSWRYLVILWNVAVFGIWFKISVLYVDVKPMLVQKEKCKLCWDIRITDKTDQYRNYVKRN